VELLTNSKINLCHKSKANQVMKIYSAQHRAIVEAPMVEKPVPYNYIGSSGLTHNYGYDQNKYNEWLTTHIPVLPEHQHLFKDGQEVKEGIDYKIEHQVCGQRDEWIESSYELYQVYVPKYRRIVAIPIKQQDILPHFPRQSESFGNYGKRMIEPPTPSIKQQVSEEDKVKPCPFCGKEPYEEVGRSVIKCYECGVEMLQNRRDKVRGIWNTRKNLEQDKERLPQQGGDVRRQWKVVFNERLKALRKESVRWQFDAHAYLDGFTDGGDFTREWWQSQLSEALAKIKSQEAEIADLRKLKP
jgi:ribosomal protein L37AE/L43A